MTKILDQAFYLKDGITVAKALLGQIIVRKVDGHNYYFKIVETEAYMGEEDKGAHVYGGKRTARTAPLYEIGGTTYVYLIYGMYYCLNISANIEGTPHCVLIRAVEPMDDLSMAFAKDNRCIKSKKIEDLTNGPGKLCKALKIDKNLNNLSVTEKGSIWIEKGDEPKQIIAGKRINIAYAKEYADMLWRFYIKDNRYVSVI